MFVNNAPTCMNCGEEECDCELAYLGGEQFADNFDDEDDDDFEPSFQENDNMELETLPIPTLFDEHDTPAANVGMSGVIVDNGLEALPIPVMNFDKPEEDHRAITSGESSQLESLPIPQMW